MKPLYALKFILLGAIALGLSLNGFAQTYNFNPGSVQSITAPAGVWAVYVDMQGGEGGNASGTMSVPGYGGRVQCVLAVTPGVTYYVYPGQAGQAGTLTAGGAGGYTGAPGIISGGTGAVYNGNISGGGGGGSSDIRVGGTAYANRIVVAGGGGGAAYTNTVTPLSDNGGNGGGLIGAAGWQNGTQGVVANSGLGGTATNGGLGAGSSSNLPYALSGGLGYGGAASANPTVSGGGGGGGYFGGGGGFNGGGGGGSSYTDPTVASSSFTHTQGYNYSGNGIVSITLGTITTSSSSLAFGALVVGSTSTAQNFTVSGTNLFAAITTPTITVTAPAGFQVSPTGAPGSYSSSFTVPYTPPTVTTPIPVYVEFTPTAYSTYSANISIAGGGTTSYVAVTGSGIFACSGNPSISAATVSPASGTAATTFVLSVAPVPVVAGVTYQWYAYATGSPLGFVAIPGATTATYNYNPSSSPFVNTFFYCVATCTNSGLTTTSGTVEAISTTTTPCNNVIAGPSNSVTATYSAGCSPGYSTNVYLVTLHTDPSYSYTWQVSTTSATSGFTNIAGANNSYITENVMGTVWIRANITCPAGTGIPANYVTTAKQLTLNPVPVISGSQNICLGTPTQYTASITGGTWTSTPLVSISPSTGIASGIAVGSAVITYTLGTGCSSTITASVNNGATNIIGNTTVCPGTNLYLTDLVSGGTWTSSNTGVATVGLSSGTVTGVSAGTSNITYTIYNGCSAVLPITDNPLPAPITAATSTLCVGLTDVLSDATSGGSWSSSNTFDATVGSASGIVTGVAAGTPNIIYTLPTGCQVTYPLPINALPGAITGTDTVCAGSTTALHDGAITGTWSSSNASLATVGTTGIVTGVAAGIPVITFTRTSNGCWVTTPVTVNALPTVTTVTEPIGGGYCPGGTGVHIGLNTSFNDINYNLYYGSSLVDVVAGSSSALDFGLYTAVGTYSVTAVNVLTGCSDVMAGSATVYNFPLPTADTVKGGGSYCAGGTGVDVYLLGSDIGTNYQILVDGVPFGSPVPGVGGMLNLGNEVDGGYYTVVATNTSTTCTSLMPSGAAVYVLPNPTAYNVSAGGQYCLGGTGVDVNLNNSTLGIFYSLYDNGTLVNTLLSTGGALDFGNQTAAGNYTVVGLNNSTHCSSNMNDTAKIMIDSLPTVYPVTGGGAYCAGSGGLHIGLDYGVVGTNYMLYRSGSLISTIAGANSGLDFGAQTTGGVYKVVGKYASTGCLDTMGSTSITIDTLATAFNVMGTGGYCVGGTGLPVTLSGSEYFHNFKYQLYRGSTLLATDNGTGSSISFGLQTVAGTYKVVALDTISTCTRTMNDSAVITVNPLPLPYIVSGGGSYCTGGVGMPVLLNGSQTGTNYQLYLGSTLVTTIAGTGSSFSFGPETGAGIYTAVAVNTVTGCTAEMTSSASVGTLPLPAVYTVSGGGTECAGGSGFPVSLSLSSSGISYRLYNGGYIGGPLLGDGASIGFGIQTAGGNYKVIATNSYTGCTDTMAGSAPIIVHALPTQYTITGGGSFCAGGTGVPVALSHSDTGGVTYKLYNSLGYVSSMTGTGSVLSFGNENVTGTYFATATSSYGCSDTMLSTINVTASPAPTVYNVTGGGSFCANDTGVHIFLSGSNTFVNYEVYRSGSIPVGSFWAGTGIRLDLGLDSVAGTYTVKATDDITGCTSMMADSAVLVSIPLVTPGVTIVPGSGTTICAGTSDDFATTTINAGSSPSFQWKVGSALVSTSSSYTYVPTNGDLVSVVMTSSANCAFPATAAYSVAMTVNPNETPTVAISTASTSVCPGSNVTFTSAATYSGAAPTYTWMVNGVSTGVSTPSYSYIPANNDAVVLAMTSDFACVTHDYVTSAPVIMTMDTPAAPSFSITGGNTVPHLENLTLTAVVTNVPAAQLTYQWTVNGNPVGTNSATYSSSSFNNGDVVCCSIFSTNSCGTSATIQECETISVGANLGVSQVNNISDIHIAPNPNKGIFTVTGNIGTVNDDNISVEITNMLGQVVYTAQVKAQNGVINEEVQLNGNVANGMYLLNVHSGAQSAVFHFVIEQ